MKNASLEYCKFILEKVSFDEFLFEKELQKALSRLTATDVKELVVWLRSKFNHHAVVRSLSF